MVRWLLCFILAVQAAVVRGAETPSDEFPFEYREGLIWVTVQAAGSPRPLQFLLDSGAEVSVINLETARLLALPLGKKVNVSSVQTTVTGYWPQKLSASANGVMLPSDFLVLDLSKFNRACAQSVDGLIGEDFFKDRIVQIDFKAQKVRLLKQDAAITGEVVTSPLVMRRCGLCAEASINGGKPQRLRVDTGCATALQWVTKSVPTNQCTSKLAVGLAELELPQTTTTVRLAGRMFQDVPTGLHRDAIFDGEAGLLGNGLLARFETVTIDSLKGQLLLGAVREPGD